MLTRATRLIFAFVFSGATMLASTALAQDESATPRLLERVEAGREEANEDARSILADLDLNANVKLDLSLFHGVETGLGYTYGVEPSYQGDMYTRIDRWRPRVAIKIPGVFTTIEPKAEIVFIRQFPSQWDAVKAVPVFDPKKIPLKTQNALRLNPGEVVMLPLELNLLFGRGVNVSASPISLYADGHYVMRGRYQVQVLRLAESRVRLRLVAIRSQGPEVEVGARLSLDVFNVGLLNSAVNGILGKKVGSVGFSRGTRAVVMADYVFDLANADAANAYDRLLAADQRFSRLRLVNPLMSAESLQNAMISDLLEVDRVAQADLQKPVQERRIWSVFKGRSEGKVRTENRNLELLRLFTLRRSTSVSHDNHLVFMDSDDEELNFFAPSATRTVQRKFLFGLGSETFTRKASVVVPATTEGIPEGMGEFVVSVEMKDKRMGKGESAKALKFFSRSLANRIVSFTGLDQLLNRVSYKHARVFVQTIFNKDAMARFEGRGVESLRASLDAYLVSARAHLPGDTDHEHLDWVKDRRKDIDRTLVALATAFTSTTPTKERIRIFIDLQKNKFFREAGTGFLMSLLPEAELENMVAVTVRADAAGFSTPLVRSFGTSDYASVVKVTEYIQHMLQDGSFDLRLDTFGTDLTANSQVVSFKELRRLSGVTR